MKKTCKYCGVVPYDHVCPHQKHYHKRSGTGEAEAFRNSRRWQRIRELIKQRDLYLCAVCRSGKYEPVRYNSEDLEVHHIDPIDEAPDRRDDEDNLITLCCLHHKMADKGLIPRESLRAMIPLSGS